MQSLPITSQISTNFSEIKPLWIGDTESSYKKLKLQRQKMESVSH